MWYLGASIIVLALGRISCPQMSLMSYGTIQTCIRYISGARYLSFVELGRRGFINPHIWELTAANREKREEEAKYTAQEEAIVV